MSINVFHTTSALKFTIIVHVNNLSYTQDGVLNIYICSNLLTSLHPMYSQIAYTTFLHIALQHLYRLAQNSKPQKNYV